MMWKLPKNHKTFFVKQMSVTDLKVEVWSIRTLTLLVQLWDEVQ